MIVSEKTSRLNENPVKTVVNVVSARKKLQKY